MTTPSHLPFRFASLLPGIGLPGLIAIVVILPVDQPQAAPGGPAPAKVDFNRQILPILSEHCFACHGPDSEKRKGGLRLDTREGAFGKGRSGDLAFVPGKLEQSAVLTRLTTSDPKEIMPPPGKGKPLNPGQINLLKKWVEEGASWTPHWAFVTPTKPGVPVPTRSGWVRNPIDQFILARLEKEGLTPSPEADRVRLMRRVSLDLTGLPPTPGEVSAFLADSSPDAYEKLVDRLLGSPRYGEQMGRLWLDAARYGDTHGLHLDNYREIWPYRDWVIRAFHSNMPFDRFLIEQIAGDLIPGATQDQLIATGFTRCHVTTSEGGSIDEEVYVRNVDDQIETTGTVFMGLSVTCGRCHDHKYDPLTQKDYYQLFAFFNSIDGPALDGNSSLPPPVIQIASREQQEHLANLKKKKESIQAKITTALAQFHHDEPKGIENPVTQEPREFVWIEDALPAGNSPSDGGQNKSWNFVSAPGHPVYSGSKSVELKASGLGQVVFQEAQQGLQIGKGDKLFAYVYLDPANPPREIMLQWHSDNWRHRAYWGDNLIPWGAENTGERAHLGPLPEKGKWVRLEVETARVGLKPGDLIVGWALTQHDGLAHWDHAGIISSIPQGKENNNSLAAWQKKAQATGGVGLKGPIVDVIKTDPAKRSPAQKQLLRDYFIEKIYPGSRSVFDPLHKEMTAVDGEIANLEKQIPSTMVFREKKEQRPAYILKRGEYDQRGAPIGRGSPGFLPPMPADAPLNRLGLARWMVQPGHPLTARVAVNRFWQTFFGTGIVKTTEEFGIQGEQPSHPELLDWLAVQFQEEGWDVKKTIRRMVLSATYRQSSRTTPQLLAKDPANRLLARGPRYRLDAEMVRDQALFVSGLLVEKVGGPSVKPPQPGGLWEAVAYPTSNTARFSPDTGHEKVHRRSLYTFWKRTAPPPQMSALDAPSRESCILRRERTNTPLQALLLLNETQMIEAARGLAQRALKEGGATLEGRLRHLFQCATGRTPEPGELSELQSAYQGHLAVYSRDVKAAEKLIAVGDARPEGTVPPAELAAMTLVGNIVLNLDEVLNKE